MTVVDKIDGWAEKEKIGRFGICGMHVDPHQSRAVRWSRNNARLLETKAIIHHGKRQWGLREKPWKDVSGYLNPYISVQEHDILVALNCEIDVPCVVELVMSRETTFWSPPMQHTVQMILMHVVAEIRSHSMIQTSTVQTFSDRVCSWQETQ